MSVLERRSDGILLRLHVQPRAAKTEIAGIHGDALKIRIASPPVDGAANEALLRFLAESLDVPQRQVELLSGHSGRRKAVCIHGVTEEEAILRLGLS